MHHKTKLRQSLAVFYAMSCILSFAIDTKSVRAKEAQNCAAETLVVKASKSAHSNGPSAGTQALSISVENTYSWQNNMPSPVPIRTSGQTTLVTLKIKNISKAKCELNLQSKIVVDGSLQEMGPRFETYISNEALAPVVRSFSYDKKGILRETTPESSKPKYKAPLPPAQLDKSGTKLTLGASETTMVTVRVLGVGSSKIWCCCYKTIPKHSRSP